MDEDGISIGEIVGGGAAAIWMRPGRVLLWGLLLLLAQLVAVIVPFGLELAHDGGLSPRGRSLIAILSLLPYLASIAIIYTAALRMTMRPREAGLAGMRIGADEIRVFLTAALVVLLFGGVAVLLFTLVGAIAFYLGNGATAQADWFLTVFGTLSVSLLWAFLGVRLSLAVPLTFLRRRFVFAESRATARRLVGVGADLIILMIGFVVIFLIGLVTFNPSVLAALHYFQRQAVRDATIGEFRLDRLVASRRGS